MSDKRITHVIFDMDGLILDTETLYTEAITELCARYGKTYTWAIKERCMGMRGDLAAQRIIEALDLPITVQQYLQEIAPLYQQVFHKAQLLPGSERLIRHLHAHAVPIAIASGSSQESYDLKTQRCLDLMALMSHKVLTSSDPEVKEGKPAPDAFLVCARRFPDPPRPDQCLVFEDAPNGIVAAVAAGMTVVAVPDPRTTPSLLQGAALVLTSLELFRPEAFGLPAFPE